MISNVVKARKREGRREDDPMQVLIDKGMSLVDITRVRDEYIYSFGSI